MRRFSFKVPFMAKVVPVVLAGMAVPFWAFADDPQTTVLKLVGYILLNWVQSIAWLLEQLTNVLVILVQYNSFYKNDIVTQGWNIVINVTNMMFIVALLVIAAGTVLSIQNYRYNRLLGNVVLMALLVNFSKLIAGFFIQLSQVVMLTFVNSFKDALFGNFATMFGLDKVFQFSTQNTLGATIKDSTSTVVSGAGATGLVNTTGQLVASLVVAMAFLVLAGAVIAAFIGIIAYRIVALWVLLILSPLAYGLAILPQTKSYADRWWKDFTEQLTRGPVIAFFLWLALAVVASHSAGASLLSGDPNTTKAIADLTAANAAATGPFASDFLGFNNIIGFIVAIVFLLTGLKYATEAGGTAGSWAKKLSGGALAAGGVVTGLNAIRDRTVKPVQGYLKARDARNNAAIQRRTEGLTLRANQVESATVGVARRGAQAAITGTRSATGAAMQATGRVAGTVLKGGYNAATAGSVGGAVRELGRTAAQAVREVGAGVSNTARSATFGAIAGARSGMADDKAMKVENDKIRGNQRKYEGEAGRYEQMGRAMRDQIGIHGSAEERYQANKVAAERKELDMANPEHRQRAEELGRQMIVAAGSGEELTKMMANIKDTKTRKAMFRGAASDPTMAVQGGKRDILASAGGIKEAYGTNLDAAADFITRNGAQVADMLKNKLISAETIRDKNMLDAVMKLDQVDDEKVIELTKDKDLAEAFSQGIAGLVDDENSKKYDKKDKEDQKKIRHRDKLRSAEVLGARGGAIKYERDGKEVNMSSMDHAYAGHDGDPEAEETKDARASLERFIRSEGKNLSKFDYEPLSADEKPSDILADTFTRNMNFNALKAVFEKNSDMVVTTLKRLQAIGEKKKGEIDETVRKMARTKANRSTTDDFLAGIVPGFKKGKDGNDEDDEDEGSGLVDQFGRPFSK